MKNLNDLYENLAKIEKTYDNEGFKTACECLEKYSEYGLFINVKTNVMQEQTISISINSCCGGCTCLNDLKYCPYCSKKLKLVKIK